MILALLILALGSLAFSQTGNHKVSDEDRTRNELMQLERDIGKANIEND